MRGNAEMEELVWSYMKRDEHPDWPYAGAEWVEEVYQEHGLDGVRAIISGLRDDPEAAVHADSNRRQLRRLSQSSGA